MADNIILSSPSTPLPLSGFINGDTIQVHGDTGNLQFSLQFNLRGQAHNLDSNSHFPDINSPGNIQTSVNSSVSTYVTPTTTHDNEKQDVNRAGSTIHEEIDYVNDCTPLNEEFVDNKPGTVVTRLRSGVLSRITYRPQCSGALMGSGSVRSWNRRKPKKRHGETRDVLDTILRRRSCPVRPCNAYSLFVMASWGKVECSSFGATSKRLGEMWCNLSRDEKKVFEDMAVKDNERYKRQCILLKNREHEETNSQSLDILENNE